MESVGSAIVSEIVTGVEIAAKGLADQILTDEFWDNLRIALNEELEVLMVQAEKCLQTKCNGCISQKKPAIMKTKLAQTKLAVETAKKLSKKIVKL